MSKPIGVRQSQTRAGMTVQLSTTERASTKREKLRSDYATRRVKASQDEMRKGIRSRNGNSPLNNVF
uniref:4F5 domain-containing protein n=1 Tax=Steinernema glaseri TaxID=37863 RepID=A0A1I7XWI6_9BILA